MTIADRVVPPAGPGPSAPSPPGAVLWRVDTRSLEGFQKESIVWRPGAAGPAWRMMSDEGPYLKGADLGPPPLSYFSAGLQFGLMAALDSAALSLTADTRYTMNGSVLRGDMTGGALPAEFRVQGPSGEELAAALRRSPAEALVRESLRGTFAVTLNGRRLDSDARPTREVPDPGDSPFESLRPDPVPEFVTKVSRARGGAPVALSPEQKRQLHLHAEAKSLGEARTESVIRVVQPPGSSFRFLGDFSDRATAPPPLAYVSAGIAFCFMTQLGRYAQIVKLRLRSLRTVQIHAFAVSEKSAAAAPVETHVFVESDESEEKIRKLAAMGEQTCFLHAAMRGPLPTVASSAPTSASML